MKRILAIRSNAYEYAEELAKQFNRKSDGIFHTLVFTDEESYRDFEANNRVDMLLCDEDMLRADNREKFQAENICALTELGIALEDSEIPGIFKYQSAESIMKEILHHFNKRQETAVERRGVNAHRVYSVTAPYGGSYSSTFALALAYYHAQGERTLFISFDPFFQLPGEIKDAKDRNLTDIIYYLEQGQKNVLSHVKKMTRKAGELECVSGASHWFDLYEMKPAHMSSLLDELNGDSAYETVIFDVGVIGASSMEVFLASDTIYVPAPKDNSSSMKLSEWKRQISFCGQAQLLDRIKEVRVPFDELLENGYSFDTLLKGRLGKFIEEMEGMQYIR